MSEPQRLPILSVTELTVTFSGQAPVEAVRGISFDLFSSEILAIVGESGSGKSATALAIPGLLPADAIIGGRVVFEGRDILTLKPRELAALRGNGIAMVFQDPAAALDPVFSIGYQLDEAIRLHEPTFSRAKRRDRAVALLEQVGIDRAQEHLARHPHELSGGQLQRVMIAMALAGRPKVLIADEPTTALDVTVQQDILDLLYRLNQDDGMAVLLITHDMGVVADIAGRVVVLHHGLVAETAPVQPLFEAPQADYTRRLLAAVPDGKTTAGRYDDGTRTLLQVRDLRLGYSTGFGRATEVVKGVSFDIAAGEFLGLVGESGSGKTTIGHSLLGLIRPFSGSASLEKHDLHGNGRAVARLRTRIGAVFQNPAGSLNPRLTVGQSIAEPIQAHGGLSRPQTEKRVEQLLEEVGLPSAWHRRYPSELSGGQRQRVAIARALALEPALLIADEPTSALDVSVQAGILDLLNRLQRQFGFACLFISHDLAVVRNLCHSVVVLRQGMAVEAGPASEVLVSPRADYTRQLVESAPLPDPRRQAQRRAERESRRAACEVVKAQGHHKHQ